MQRKNTQYFRRFGFELEFSTPIKQIKPIIKRILSSIYGKNHLAVDDGLIYSSNNNYKKWELKIDGSTESELTTPISKILNFKKIEKVLGAISKRKFKITHKDSVHVHMQADDVPKHNIIAAWLQIEKNIMMCFPKHRRDNNYCQQLIHWKRYKKISDFFLDAEIESNAHHSILSLNYYSNRKTVEFRIMEGNIDINDIKPWVKFCMLFLNYAKNIDPIEIICEPIKIKKGVDNIIDLLNINDIEVIDFLRRREKAFTGKSKS